MTPPLKVQIFVDGTWLYYTMVLGRKRTHGEGGYCPMTAKFGPRWQSTHSFAWSKLPQVVASQLTRQLQTQHSTPRAVEVVRTSVYTSVLADTPIQGSRAAMIEDWYRSNFEVHMLTTPEAQGNATRTQEKCVDIMVACDLLYGACTDSFDVGVLVTGDKDFIPALQKTRQAAKRVAVASVRNSCNRDLTRQDLHIRDFDVIWLEDHLDALLLEKAKTLPLSQATEDRLFDLVVQSMRGAERHTITSRELGRFLQSHQLSADEAAGQEPESALALLKKSHGSIRSFLSAHSQEFKVVLLPADYPDYSIQWRGGGAAFDDDEGEGEDKGVGDGEGVGEEEGGMLLAERIGNVVGIDDGEGLGSAGTDSESWDEEEEEDDEDEDEEDEDEDDGEERDGGKAGSETRTKRFDRDALNAALVKLTVSDLRAEITRLGESFRSRDTKAALVATVVDASARLFEKEEAAAAVKARAKIGAKAGTKTGVKSGVKSGAKAEAKGAGAKGKGAASVAAKSGGDDATIKSEMRALLLEQPSREMNSRELGRVLAARGHLEGIKRRHTSLRRFLLSCAADGEPLLVTAAGESLGSLGGGREVGGREFSVRLEVDA